MAADGDDGVASAPAVSDGEWLPRGRFKSLCAPVGGGSRARSSKKPISSFRGLAPSF